MAPLFRRKTETEVRDLRGPTEHWRLGNRSMVPLGGRLVGARRRGTPVVRDVVGVAAQSPEVREERGTEVEGSTLVPPL